MSETKLRILRQQVIDLLIHLEQQRASFELQGFYHAAKGIEAAILDVEAVLSWVENCLIDEKV